MDKLMALDVAILPPPEVAARIVALSRALPDEHEDGLRLGDDRLPHITLTQQFVREAELETAFEHIDAVLATSSPFDAVVTGGGHSGHTLWLEVEAGRALVELHEQLMEALRGVERQGGTPGAFYDDDARVADVMWVAGYRLKSSFGHFKPHITLAHGTDIPHVDPFAFRADSVAACHLGRHCTCRRVLRRWTLRPPGERRDV